MNILPIDELNAFEAVLAERKNSKKEMRVEDIIDEMLDLFLLAYASGVTAANSDLGTEEKPTESEMQSAVYAEVAGKTWEQRVKEYMAQAASTTATTAPTTDTTSPVVEKPINLAYDLARIAETDMTRIYNTAVLDTVKANRVEDTTYKRWVTMADDRVRETHDYLENIKVPYDADFVTYDGDRAKAPGLFSLPENNINCRCTISLERG